MVLRLQEIYIERRRALERFLSRILRNADDAADVAQEAFLRVYAAEVGGQTPASEALLYTVAKNLALTELRRRTSRATDSRDDMEELNIADEHPNPETQLQQRQMVQAVERAMKHMPPRCLEAFKLQKIDGLAYAEIAERMNISPRTVERHLAQALVLCHDALVDMGQKPGRHAAKPL